MSVEVGGQECDVNLVAKQHAEKGSGLKSPIRCSDPGSSHGMDVLLLWQPQMQSQCSSVVCEARCVFDGGSSLPDSLVH